MSEYTQSEQPAIELLKQLGYEYLDAKGEMYETLKQGFNMGIKKVVND